MGVGRRARTAGRRHGPHASFSIGVRWPCLYGRYGRHWWRARVRRPGATVDRLRTLESPEAGRGAGWVVAQFALMAVILGATLVPPRWSGAVRPWLAVLGAFLAVTGVALTVWAARTMGRLLTPFPKPPDDGLLIVHGPFAYVRHPVYLGLLLVFGGIALATSVAAAIATVVLGLLWLGKARVEERHLGALYPEYASYAGRVRSRIFPRPSRS